MQIIKPILNPTSIHCSLKLWMRFFILPISMVWYYIHKLFM